MQDMMLLDRRTKDLVKEYVPEGDVLDSITCFFGVFSDATRVRILSALAISEMCVTDLSRVLDINHTTVSHQLRLLKNLGIVKSERDGKIITYSLVNDTVNDVMLKG
ncbi:MAG: metalloregulator ArsR/SmtB family transcription factor, partial [Clostridia bacterium]|nr:metalloregulator ArsR/SmtB family transcription factor [Clostridia bacterium]